MNTPNPQRRSGGLATAASFSSVKTSSTASQTVSKSSGLFAVNALLAGKNATVARLPLRGSAETSYSWNGSPLSLWQILAAGTIAVASFYLAYWSSATSFCIVGFLGGLFVLRRAATPRKAFYSGLLLGLAAYAPHLAFFWKIFGAVALALWTVLAFWIGLFVLLARACHLRWPGWRCTLLIPFLWLGFEYFRSELYPLRFSWLNTGFALAHVGNLSLLAWLGVYGLGFVLMLAVAGVSLLPRKPAFIAGAAGTAGLIFITHTSLNPASLLPPAGKTLAVAGVQLEFPTEQQVLTALDGLLARFPDAGLLVLSEYTFSDGPVPQSVKDWCRKHGKHLIVGGKSPAPDNDFYNTAFVVGPTGEIVFEQAKAVPIQFFKDGRPAPAQKVWDSPWGKLGICICYDLSYTRVTDELVRQGALALIVPTMDVQEWGKYQHELHARVAPVRAAEYGLPIFRLASSGISQLVDMRGSVVASAPFPGDEEMIAGLVRLSSPGRLPLDRYLGPLAVGITTLTAIWLLFTARSVRKEPPVTT